MLKKRDRLFQTAGLAGSAWIHARLVTSLTNDEALFLKAGRPKPDQNCETQDGYRDQEPISLCQAEHGCSCDCWGKPSSR
jgi:hypothetical protein